MIISASRRTDIPAYYPEWFMKRIRTGFVLTRNPMNRAQLSRIPLSPDVVDCIVFWTKDAANIMPHLDELDARGFNYYFQFTLTPYGRDLERNLRPKADIMDTFAALSKRVGRQRVVWRYDPIVVNDTYTVERHKAEFSRMCRRLAPYTDTVVISFVDMYPKLKTDAVRPIDAIEAAQLAEFIGKIAKECGITAAACCETADLTKFGITRSSCIDRGRIEKICGCAVDLAADKNQRPGCGCAASVDIGAYNTCLNGCVYCYATDSFASARRRYDSHRPDGELLVGAAADGEKIADRKVKSDKRSSPPV